MAKTRNAAVLIDWENFFHGRERNEGEDFDIRTEIELLATFVQRLLRETDERMRVSVWRAYADFNVSRPNPTGPGYEYFLQKTPFPLMRSGIEPVQVFSYPGANRKNAADMRMIVEGLRLRSEDTGIDAFVIVSGDADFIPLASELRRLGAFVVTIGIRGQTKDVVQKHVDRFEYFEDLVEAEKVTPSSDQELSKVSSALRELVANGPIPFAAVKPLLNKELGAVFDPQRFESSNTGEFLRTYAPDLGVGVRKVEHDWELYRLDAKKGESETPRSTTARPSVAIYRQMLRSRPPKIFELSPQRWSEIAPVVIAELRGLSGGETVDGDALLELVCSALESLGVEDAGRAARSAVFQMLNAGVFEGAETGVKIKSAKRQFWECSLRLHDMPGDDAASEIIRRVTDRLVAELVSRTSGSGATSLPIDPDVVAALVYDGDVPEGGTDFIRALIERDGTES